MRSADDPVKLLGAGAANAGERATELVERAHGRARPLTEALRLATIGSTEASGAERLRRALAWLRRRGEG